MSVTTQQTRLLAGFHEQVVSFMVNEPVDHVLFAFGPTATRSSEYMRGWRVDGKGKEVGWFGEIGHEAAVEDEVDQDEDVHEEDEK